MIFGSVCSGIEAASVAWHPLGWRAAWLAEMEPFPSAVLAHHYPHVPNLGDMTKIAAMMRAGVVLAPDVLVGGTPCQAFSIAGLRHSLDDARGQLSLSFVDLANAIDAMRSVPAIIVWENVPGVLSTRDNAFGCFLAGLAGEDAPLLPPRKRNGKIERWPDAGCVFGPQRTVAWRVLDAQYFGLAQRRRRVFVVASARDWFDPAAILFEREGVRRDTPPGREARETAADATAPCLTSGDQWVERTDETHGQDPVVAIHYCLAHGQGGAELGVDRAPTLTCNHEAPIAAYSVALRSRDGGSTAELGDEVARCLRASCGGGDKAHVLAPACITGSITHALKAEGFDASEDGTGRGYPIVTTSRQVAQCLTGNYGKQLDNSDTRLGPNVAIHGMAVRRLVPKECERLQGFADDYTLVMYRGKPAADGPRYRVLGNSMAVPVMRWIGERIGRVERLLSPASPE